MNEILSLGHVSVCKSSVVFRVLVLVADIWTEGGVSGPRIGVLALYLSLYLDKTR